MARLKAVKTVAPLVIESPIPSRPPCQDGGGGKLRCDRGYWLGWRTKRCLEITPFPTVEAFGSFCEISTFPDGFNGVEIGGPQSGRQATKQCSGAEDGSCQQQSC